mmetsp:Transcript_15594/g.13634  ORF Transcript_15594/g.13634 Transcript_15594/m.13634 type:complete len:251 (-) Transcript_15594:454-1206(-)
MVKEDLRNTQAQMVMIQLDPMPYAEMSKKVMKIKIEEELIAETDRVQAQKNFKEFIKEMNSQLHPNHGLLSILDLSLIEILFNAQNKNKNEVKFVDFLDKKTHQLILKSHLEELTIDEETFLNERKEKIQGLLEFLYENSLSKVNPSPYYGMDLVFKSALNSTIDICFCEHPEPLNRLYAYTTANLDKEKTKSILDASIHIGTNLFNASQIFGNDKKLAKVYQRRTLNEIFPDLFVKPRDEYIASQIIQL